MESRRIALEDDDQNNIRRMRNTLDWAPEGSHEPVLDNHSFSDDTNGRNICTTPATTA